ncbi:MAG: 50S ribosomal protein L10 [Candidatus Berkelbacteria bacterium]|nr:MAG: 50S ribosomal protein L10 [Candidatus Berkelbacteria bacterium]QQG51439.1 MAG: 50S ribosomal protein L10 [Candidatus Berkelbacteria bacterium]
MRAQKEALVESLVTDLQESRVALIVAYTKLNMKANDELRTKTFEQNGKIKMLSNNLLRLILKRLGREIDIPEKTLALAYGFQDEVTAAKTLVEFGKETEALEVLGGWIDGSFFDASQVKTLASLPNKETLQAQLVGRLGGLIGSLAYSLNYPMQKFAFVVEAVKSSQPASPVVEEAKTEVTEAANAESGQPKEETETVETPAQTSEENAEVSTEESEIKEEKESFDSAQDEEVNNKEEVKENNE